MPKTEFVPAVLVEDERPAPDVRELLIAPQPGARFPGSIPGGHVQVRHLSGVIRQYSLIGAAADDGHYRVAIKRYDEGRGGSLTFHRDLSVGDRLDVSAPVPGMTLDDTAKRHVFIAGGIGVTAILGLLTSLTPGTKGEVHYCVRDKTAAPYLERLEAHGLPLRVYESDLGNFLNPTSLIESLSDGSAIYQCGPPSLMDAVDVAALARPKIAVHREIFNQVESYEPNPVDEAFEVRLARRGAEIRVGAEESMLRALIREGINADYSCEAGECGTCILDYLEGNPIHRDTILEGDERDVMITPCVSRAKGHLTIDL